MGKSIYVGSSLFNIARVRVIQARLKSLGAEISHDWTAHGRVFTEEDLAKIGQLEEDGVRNCQLFFMVHPARNGTHCELGMARALDKHIVILEDHKPDELKPFYYRPAGHERPIHRFTSEDEAITFAIRLLENQ